MKRIIQAHRLHHVVEPRTARSASASCVAPRPKTLKAELKRRSRAGVRAPVRAEPVD